MLYLSPNEANLFECSIFHYFIWRHEEAKLTTDAEQQNDDTIAVDTIDNSHNYKRIIQVMKEELPHVATMMSETTPTLLSSSSTPEVCFRWMKYATIRNILVNTEIPRYTKRERDMADETARLAKTLKSIPEEEITLENAKGVLSTLKIEHSEVKMITNSLESELTKSKKITDSLELKLKKSERIYSELLKFNNKKLRLEKRLATLQSVEEEANDNHDITNLESSEATTEQNILDDQHYVVTAMKDGEGGDQESNDVRANLKIKKRKLEVQETIYANAILYEAHHDKEQQKVAKNGNKLIDFESRIQELFEFKQEFGHCQVGMKLHRSLYFWLMKVRKYYRLKTPALTPERIAKLDSLGVVWDINGNKQKTFDYYVEQCRDFKEKHGHLRIPLLTGSNDDGTEPTNDDIRFRIWAQSMRQQYKKRLAIGSLAKLDQHRIAILDSIGFEWNIDASSYMEGGSNIDVENLTSRDMMFRTRIEQLRKVKEIYGEQRARMRFLLSGKRSRLTEERQEMLRSIEFDYNPRNSCVQPTTQQKKRLTKMEILALEIQEKKKNHHQDSENNISDYDDSDIDE